MTIYDETTTDIKTEIVNFYHHYVCVCTPDYKITSSYFLVEVPGRLDADDVFPPGS